MFSEIISILLIYRVWLKSDSILLKLLTSLALLIPFFGPSMHFLMKEKKSNISTINDVGPRGDYTHRWKVLKPIWIDIINKKTKSLIRKNNKE
jgi:hypothetical protein